MRVSSIRIYILIDPFNKGLLTQNATWCQNRGCICISSVRRTYGRIHKQFPAYNPVIQTRIIILWSELFPKKRREKIQGEILQIHILQDSFEYSVFLQELQCFYTQSSHPVQETILHTELILLQELQGSSRADHYKASSSNCSPCIQAFYTAESSHKAPTAFQGHTAQAGFQ